MWIDANPTTSKQDLTMRSSTRPGPTVLTSKRSFTASGMSPAGSSELKVSPVNPYVVHRIVVLILDVYHVCNIDIFQLFLF